MAEDSKSAVIVNELRDVHSRFLQKIENDIRKTKSIDEKWKKVYIGNCHRIRNEMYEFQFEFIEETVAKIKVALTLGESDSARNDIYLSFQMVFDEIAVRCTHADNEMKTILKALTDQDPHLSQKYGIYCTIGLGTAFVGSALAGILIGHALPASLFACTIAAPVAVPILIVGAILLSATACTTLWQAGSTEKELRAHANIYNWAAQCFPTFGKLGPHGQCTDKEIEEKFRKILSAMKADEGVWKSNIKLEELKKSLEKNALRLRKEKDHVEKQDNALAN